MARALKTYDLLEDTPHEEATSTGTADVATITPAVGDRGISKANACYLSAITSGCYVTFDGSTPSATNGLFIPSGTAPILVLLGETIKFVSATASGTTLKVLWLT